MTEPTDKPLLDDQQLEDYLKGDSSVSRQYRSLPGADVPPSLDRLVLQQAEDAVKRSSRPTWMRWAKPLAVAASTVLVVSIVVETGMRDETVVTSQVSAPRMEAQVEAKKAGAPAPAADEPRAVHLEMPKPKASAEPPVVYVDSVKSPTFADMAPPPPPPAMMPSEPSPALAPPELEVQGQVAQAEEEDRAAVAAELSRLKSTREESNRERTLDIRAARNAAPQAAAAPGAPPAAVLSYSRPINAAATDNVATLKRTYTDPEEWLKDIRQLRKDNKQDEANTEWQRFLSAFPDYAVAETDSAREPKK